MDRHSNFSPNIFPSQLRHDMENRIQFYAVLAEKYEKIVSNCTCYYSFIEFANVSEIENYNTVLKMEHWRLAPLCRPAP